MSQKHTPSNAETPVAWKRSLHEFPQEPTRNGALKRVLIRHEDVHSPLMFFNEVYVAPGERVDRHQHEDMEEVFYFLEGEGTMQLAEEMQTVSAGDRVIVPMRVSHVVENTGTQEMRFVCFGVKALPDELWEGWQPDMSHPR
jgi:mannose-6-phosphate isomerase-like protein (cupin superfamily)